MKFYSKFLAAVLLFVFVSLAKSQVDSGLVAGFMFDGNFTDVKGVTTLTAHGGSFTEDRFGNEDRAYFIPGNFSDYINLGSSNKLKPTKATISLWVNIYQGVFSGYGVLLNPIMMTRSHAGEDCNEAFYIGYDMNMRKFNVNTTLSELHQVNILQKGTAYLKKWYHLAITFDDNFLCFYVDGELQGKTRKSFKSQYLQGDSIVVGNRTSIRNNRYLLGCVDDIRIYNRVLSPTEIEELFNAPDPNRARYVVNILLVILVIVTLVFALILFIRRRIEKGIAVEKEKNQLRNHWYEQENRVLTAQMDPHFIFNSLNTIQQFIITNDNESAQIYLSKFSRLILKLLESNTKESISLREEIEIFEKYIEIESIRFNNVFNYSINVADDVDKDKTMIPHFLIQPIIENAIWHGLLLKNGDKELNITFERGGDRQLICVVDDNGVGRKNANPPSNEVEKRKSLALNFIEQRLEVMGKMMKSKFGIQIIDKEDTNGLSLGTKVVITLPVLSEQ